MENRLNNMKPTITSDEGKALFFAQYYDQVIMCLPGVTYRIDSYNLSMLIRSNDIKQAYLLLRGIDSLSEEEVCNVAELLHPGNDRCTVIKNYGDGKYAVDVDSSCSIDYSLQIELDFKQIYNQAACSAIHGIRYDRSITDRSRIMVFQYLLRIGILLPFTYLDANNTPITLSPAELVNRGWCKIKTV